MAHDPVKYPSPDKFDPERFLDSDGKLLAEAPDFVFGFGRRICPGRHLAENSVFILIACILQVLVIVPELDENGVEKIGERRWINGVAT